MDAIDVGRIYGAAAADGARVLVDRLWPRGVSKEDAALDLWARDVAPTDELRRWYDHDPDRFEEFERRYRAELADDDHRGALDELLELAAERGVVLLTATKTVDLSHAAVLAAVLRERL